MAADICSPRAGKVETDVWRAAEQSAQASKRPCLTKQGGRHLHVHPYIHKQRDQEGENQDCVKYLVLNSYTGGHGGNLEYPEEEGSEKKIN